RGTAQTVSEARQAASATGCSDEEWWYARSALLAELPNAIAQDQLTLHYQPKIDLRTGRTVAVEALVRWQHAEHGLIYPDRFIWLTESAQLIDALTQWVLARALNQWRDWNRAQLHLGLSINLSARNLLDRMLRAKLLELARELVVPLDFLTLEITESTIVADPARARRVMTDLHHLGVRFTMEDFGVGQRSAAYLKDLPISRMKIDKSLVMDFGNARNAAIVRDAIALAHGHDMKITAEGVEDEATRAALQALGCDLAQGYLFARPMPEAELFAWLRESPWGGPGGTGAS
ncbi:MAG: EAL domain-containing protein, partial [Rhodanobacter sp.]